MAQKTRVNLSPSTAVSRIIGQERKTTYHYNSIDQLLSKVDHQGNQTHYAYDRLDNQTTILYPIFQNEAPKIKKEFSILGHLKLYQDENGNRTRYVNNLYGQSTEIILPDQSKEQRYYTPSGRLKQKILPDGTQSLFTYNPKGNLIEEKTLDVDDNLIKSETYHYRGPLLVSKTDAMGLKTIYKYDDAGRKCQEKIGDLKTIFFSYDDFDRLIERKEGPRSEYFQYDSLDNLTEKKVEENGSLISKQNFEYDIQGNLTKKIDWQKPHVPIIAKSHTLPDGNLAWEENPFGHRTSYIFEYPSVITTKTITDPLSRNTVETYDPYQRIIKRELFEEGIPYSRTEWTYDLAGNCILETSTVMAMGNPIREYSIKKSYNNRGLLVEEKEMPNDKVTSYRYDKMKRLKKMIKPDGTSIAYSYDALGRKESLRSSDEKIAYIYQYDLHDNIIKIVDPIHNIAQKREFDLYNRLIKEELYPDLEIAYSYDILDRLTKVALPDKTSISYYYQPYLKQIKRCNTQGKTLYKIDCNHDLQGNLLDHTTSAGKTNVSYDLLNRPIAIRSKHWEMELQAFDAVGNLLSTLQKDPKGILKEEFCYDRFNHLMIENQNRYSYDSLGNCLRKNHNHFAINPLNQLIDNSKSQYRYDLNGNLIQETHPHIDYTYDALNRLIACESNGCKTTFLYDAFDRCLQIADPSGTKNLLYQHTQEIGSFENNSLQELRVVHPNMATDKTFSIELSHKTYFPIQDFRGNICALQNPDGSLAEFYRYSAFGKTSPITLNPWRFANRRQIADLTLFTHRFYNPRLMRWLTPDPIGFADGLNLYTYLHNQPFCYKDLDGKFAIVLVPLAGAFGATGLVLSGPTLGAIAGIVCGAALGWAASEGFKWCDHTFNHVENENEDAEVSTNKENKKGKKPLGYEEFEEDITKNPPKGFEWKGRGDPESGKGRWVKNLDQPNEITFHPDFNHQPPIKPHWDYIGPDGKARIFLDGSWEWK